MQPQLKISKSKQKLQRITADDTVNTPGGPVAVHETDYGPLFCGLDVKNAMQNIGHLNYKTLPSWHEAYIYKDRKNVFVSLENADYMSRKAGTPRAEAVYRALADFVKKHRTSAQAQEGAKPVDMHAELEKIEKRLYDKIYDVLDADMGTLKTYVDEQIKNHGTAPVESTLTIELRPLSQVLGKSMTAAYQLIKNGTIKGRLAQKSAGDPTSADSVYKVSRNSLGAYMENE